MGFLIKWAMVKFGHQKGGFFFSSQSFALASYDIGPVLRASDKERTQKAVVRISHDCLCHGYDSIPS